MFILLCNAHDRFMPFNHTFNSLRMCRMTGTLISMRTPALPRDWPRVRVTTGPRGPASPCPAPPPTRPGAARATSAAWVRRRSLDTRSRYIKTSICDHVAGRKPSGAASTSKASFNRFSVFVKSGSENYILGKVNLSVTEAEVLTVVETAEGRYSWQTSQPPYSCVIASPKKEAKFKGLKSYIAYQLTPSVSAAQSFNIDCRRKTQF